MIETISASVPSGSPSAFVPSVKATAFVPLGASYQAQTQQLAQPGMPQFQFRQQREPYFYGPIQQWPSYYVDPTTGQQFWWDLTTSHWVCCNPATGKPAYYDPTTGQQVVMAPVQHAAHYSQAASAYAQPQAVAGPSTPPQSQYVSVNFKRERTAAVVRRLTEGNFVCLLKSTKGPDDTFSASGLRDVNQEEMKRRTPIYYYYVDSEGNIIGSVTGFLKKCMKELKINAVQLGEQWESGDEKILAWWDKPLKNLIQEYAAKQDEKARAQQPTRRLPSAASTPAALPQATAAQPASAVACASTATPSADATQNVLLAEMQKLMAELKNLKAQVAAQAQISAQTAAPEPTQAQAPVQLTPKTTPAENPNFPPLPQTAKPTNWAAVAKKIPTVTAPTKKAAIPAPVLHIQEAPSQGTSLASKQKRSPRKKPVAAPTKRDEEPVAQSTPPETAEEKEQRVSRRLEEETKQLLTSTQHREKALRNALERYTFQSIVPGANAALKDEDEDTEPQKTATAALVAACAVQNEATESRQSKTDRERNKNKKKKEEPPIDTILKSLPQLPANHPALMENSCQKADQTEPVQKKENREQLLERLRQARKEARDKGQINKKKPGTPHETEGSDLMSLATVITDALAQPDPYKILADMGTTFTQMVQYIPHKPHPTLKTAIENFVRSQLPTFDSWSQDPNNAPQNPALIQAICKIIDSEQADFHKENYIRLTECMFKLHKHFPFIAANPTFAHAVRYQDKEIFLRALNRMIGRTVLVQTAQEWESDYRSLAILLQGRILYDQNPESIKNSLNFVHLPQSPFFADLQKMNHYPELSLIHYFFNESLKGIPGEFLDEEVHQKTLNELRAHETEDAELAYRALQIYQKIQKISDSTTDKKESSEIEEFFKTDDCFDVSRPKMLSPFYMFLRSLYGLKNGDLEQATLAIEEYLLNPNAFNPNAPFNEQSYHWFKIILKKMKSLAAERKQKLTVPALWADALFNQNLESYKEVFTLSVDKENNVVVPFSRELLKDINSVKECAQLLCTQQNQISHTAQPLIEHLQLIDSFILAAGQVAVGDDSVRSLLSNLLVLIEQLPLETIFPEEDEYNAESFLESFQSITETWRKLCAVHHKNKQFKSIVTPAEKRVSDASELLFPAIRTHQETFTDNYVFIVQLLCKGREAEIAQAASHLKALHDSLQQQSPQAGQNLTQFATSLADYLSPQNSKTYSPAHLYLAKVIREINPECQLPASLKNCDERSLQIILQVMSKNRANLHHLIKGYILQQIIGQETCTLSSSNPLSFFSAQEGENYDHDTEKHQCQDLAASAQYFLQIVEDVCRHPEKANDKHFESLCQHINANLPALKKKAFRKRSDQHITVTFVVALYNFIKALSLLPNSSITAKTLVDYGNYFYEGQLALLKTHTSYSVAHRIDDAEIASIGLRIMYELGTYIAQKGLSPKDRYQWEGKLWKRFEADYRQHTGDVEKRQYKTALEYLHTPPLDAIDTITLPPPVPQ